MSELAWLNQVHIYFSILQRKAINSNDFTDLDQLSERLIGFQDRYNTTAKPFDWTYTRDDLNAFLHRLARHTAHPSTRRMTPTNLRPRPHSGWQPNSRNIISGTW